MVCNVGSTTCNECATQSRQSTKPSLDPNPLPSSLLQNLSSFAQHHFKNIFPRISMDVWLHRWAAMPIVAAGRCRLTLDRERCEHQTYWTNRHQRSPWVAVIHVMSPIYFIHLNPRWGRPMRQSSRRHRRTHGISFFCAFFASMIHPNILQESKEKQGLLLNYIIEYHENIYILCIYIYILHHITYCLIINYRL